MDYSTFNRTTAAILLLRVTRLCFGSRTLFNPTFEDRNPVYPASRHVLANGRSQTASRVWRSQPPASSSRCLCWTGSTSAHVGDYSTCHPDSNVQRECLDKCVQRFSEVVFVFLSCFRTGSFGRWLLIGTAAPLRACFYPPFDQSRPSARPCRERGSEEAAWARPEPLSLRVPVLLADTGLAPVATL